MKVHPSYIVPVGKDSVTQSEVYERIAAERRRQDSKFGPPDLSLGEDRWMTILTEEFLELARALNDREPAYRVQEELVQVAAVAVRWLETRAPRWSE